MTVNGYGPLHFRELTPKDLYFAQVLRQTEGSHLQLIERLLLNSEVLDELPGRDFRKVLVWVVDNLLNEKLLTVENWMELCFHLCKQRWDSSMDWLETLPMSKIFLMVDILQKHVERENSEVKKSSRRR